MKKIILFLLLNILYLNALDFKVASYNVENLFDLNKDGTEYKEFKPYSKYWNKKALNTKINNIVKVINDLNASIISLQEIESKKALDLLLNKLPQYKYSYFLKNKKSAIGLAILSKYKIIANTALKLNTNNPYSRPILKSIININNHKLIIYSNHWKSKRSAESTRIPYAQALIKDIKKLNKDDDYIILGDLNSNYNEYITFKNDKKLNDTYGITAINQVLNTSLNNNLINKNYIVNKKENIHYNLWLELIQNNRFSSIFKKIHNSSDNIILSKSLFDNKNIYYVDKSFNVFKKDYLFSKYIHRWNMKKQNGYSDHLPIYASFSTNQQKYKLNNSISKKGINNLYKIQYLNNSIRLNDVIVIYKYKNIAIIKNKNSKAIMIYKKNNNLKLGYKYNLEVNQIKDYYGVKEIVKFKIINSNRYSKEYKKLYINAKNFDILNPKYQNEVITNLSGIYKNKYLEYKNKKIYLYFNKGIKKPKQNQKITINNAILSIYKSKIQINIYKQSDFKALYR